MKRSFQHDDDTFVIDVERDGDALIVRLADGSEHRIRVRRMPDGDIEVSEGDRVFRVPAVRDARGGVTLAWAGETFTLFPAADASALDRAAGRGAARRSGVLTAPMVGVVADVKVSVGDAVAAYQLVAVVEAMKVLATVEAPFAGIVRAVHVRKGDRVEHGAPLVEIAPADAEASQ